jgi:hypothetical protein
MSASGADQANENAFSKWFGQKAEKHKKQPLVKLFGIVLLKTHLSNRN